MGDVAASCACGSVALTLDSSGDAVSKHGWDAYGTSLGTAPSGPYGYGAAYGYFTDAETGLCALAFRHYDPAAGRFLNRDPIGYAGGVNLYGYVGNGPTGAVDPLGTAPLLVVTTGGGALVGGIAGGVSAWMKGENVWAGIGKGAVTGAVAGFAGGGGYLVMGSLMGGGALGATMSAGFGGATGNVASQGVQLGLGWRDRFSDGELGCSILLGMGLGGGYSYRREIRFGPDVRIAPFGNRPGHPVGRYTHYHRRGRDAAGNSVPGQGIGRHRPWERKSTDSRWSDRF